MENAVNKRVLMLKSELRLNDVEFCGRASISTSTLHKVKNGESLTQRTLNSIIDAFNVNKEWLYYGKGKMFNSGPDPESLAITNNWKDEAYSLMREQLAKKDAMIEQLMAMLAKSGNFLLPLNETGRADDQPALRVAA